jgi:hypothetical protein
VSRPPILKMKTIGAWLELSVVAGGLTAVMFVAMWAQRPAAGCALPQEAPRPLVLTRETDREHLAADLAAADRIARRSMRSADASQQHTRFLSCEDTLVQQIAITHGLSRNQVRASPPDAE